MAGKQVKHEMNLLKGVLDPSYVERVGERVDSLGRKTVSLREGVKHTKRELSRRDVDLREEMKLLKTELSEIEGDISDVMKRVQHTVGKFRDVSLKSDFRRLEAKSDAWAPEKRITRKEFKDLLDDLR